MFSLSIKPFIGTDFALVEGRPNDTQDDGV